MSPTFSLDRRLYPAAALVAYALTVFAGCSCVDEKRKVPDSAQEPSSDLDRFSKRVNLLDAPQSVSYKVIPSGKGDGLFGPTDYRLIAVLQYDQASLARLRSRGTRLNAADRARWLPDRPSWFPTSLLAAIQRCSDHWCIDGEEYSATEFLKGGFVTGTYIISAGGDFVILLLGT